jgi:hypothetical protein
MSRRANNAGRGARRRRLQGCEIEKRQDKLAPCAPALFIGPSARSASHDARLPCPHHISNPKQRLDGYARVELGRQIPRLGRFDSRDVFRPPRVAISKDGFLTSARTVVGQHRARD